MEKLKKNKELLILSVLFAGYLIFNGILLAGHELWRDEANVWLFARDTSPLQLLLEIKYQGHPCLWYFIVMPFAKLGLPFKTLSVLSFLVMAAAAGVFTYKAPLHPVSKLVCLISPMFSYYYSVVARNYCLIALILILLAYCYPKRHEKSILYGLLLGLLVQADTIALAAAGLISCMWLWESVHLGLKEKNWAPVLQAAKGLWIPLASLIFWMMQFYQVSESSEFNMNILSPRDMLREIRNFSYHILTRMTGQGEGFDLLLIVLTIAAGVCIFVKSKNLWPMIVMAGAFLFEVVFSIMVYQLHIWHYISLCFVLIWFLWVGALLIEKKPKWLVVGNRIVAEGLLILLGVTMFMRWNAPEESSSLSNALDGLYSDGVHAAEYIAEHIGPDEMILSTCVAEASTVQAYLGKVYAFYYAGLLEPITYANYNEDQNVTITYAQLMERLKKEFPERQEVYLLVSSVNCVTDIPEEVMSSWEVCYQTQEKSARGENYTLYKIQMQ